jgi:hypothetical protein
MQRRLCQSRRYRTPVPEDALTRRTPNDERPPICPACGVTMVPAALSAESDKAGEWVCLECEELDERDGA